MYKTILVPLDGSEQAEAIFPYVNEFAQRLDSELILLSIYEPGHRLEHLLKVYLSDKVSELRKQGIRARSAIVEGKPADEILAFSEQNDASLIALTSHGRSGDSRWNLGSVVDKILRGADIPVLVIRAKAFRKQPESVTLKKVLLPLDLSAFSETSIGYVTELASRLKAEVLLLHVISAYSGEFPSAARLQALSKQQARKYLREVEETFKNEGIMTKLLVKSGSPALDILSCAQKNRVDLIAISTHGRGGLGRWAYGSVASKLLHSAEIPILLVRAAGAGLSEAGLVGELVKQCHNCGAVIRREVVLPQHTCYRCGHHLRACANCTFFEGFRCVMQRPEATDIYGGNNCPVFQFRERPVMLR